MSEGITFNLSNAKKMLREVLAREFAAEVIRPAAPHHDSTGEYAWDVLTQAWEAWLRMYMSQKSLEDWVPVTLKGILIAEELAWGCSGIGTAMEANGLA